MAVGNKPQALLVAESEVMQRVREQIEHLAAGDEPVLVEGEPGSGRELVARAIHTSSPRSKGELVSVRAAAAPLAECPIAGGAAEASASGGTLLVKDVCELGKAQQKRLARVLAGQRGQPVGDGVRLIATTDPGLDAAVEAEIFHGPLYASLAANTVIVPPLRDRVQDIAPLMAQLVREYGREIGRRRVTVSTRAYDRMVTYPWPGNVAELKLVARRLVIRCQGARIDASDVDAVLPMIGSRVPLEEMSFEEMVRVKVATFLRHMGDYPIDNLYDDVIQRVERELFDLVMEHTGGNQVKASEILGVSRNTLRRKLGPKTPAHSAKRSARTSGRALRAGKTGKRR